MKKIATTLTVTATALLLTSNARSQGHEELYRFSNYEWNYGTARSAAMGGAFTSLGADLSSPMLNPAGLGMYLRSEFGMSPSMTTLKTKTEHLENGNFGHFNNSANRNRFTLNNIGSAFNVYRGSGDVTSITLGITYNKLSDFNTHTTVFGRSDASLLYLFRDQLNTNRLSLGDVDDLFEGNRSYAGIAGAVVAGYSGLVYYDEQEGQFNMNETVPANATFYSEMNKRTQGSTGQFDMSMGMNVGNKFYFGLGFGFQDIFYKENFEYYEHPENAPSEEYQLDHYTYNSYIKQSGTAWNFKFGVIVRPVEELRIGIAFHTPTKINLHDDYYVRLDNQFYQGSNWAQSHVFKADYRLRTPMRLLTGASYTFYNMAILTVDYERIWYNQMKFFWDGCGSEYAAINREVKDNYKASDNLRAGLETLLAPNWYGRLGFAWYGSPYKSARLITDDSDWKKYDGTRYNYSAGVGYRTGNWGIDLVYIYMDSKDAPEYVYDYYDAQNGIWTTSYKAKRQRNNVTLTASVRF
ncbi:MAG: hypothetical protein LUD68_04680 [Rikenellaceae bacterium]|nr:hypothetical protein [Rikenellaceae bacterium]